MSDSVGRETCVFSDELAEVEPWTEILLRGVVGGILEAGLSRERVASELRKWAKRVESGESVRPLRSEDMLKIRKVGEVVRDWACEPSFTSPINGQPRALRLDSGEGTLRELIERRFPSKEVERVVDWMERRGVILPQDDGAYVLKRPGNLLMIESDAGVERAATLVVQQLRAGLSNLRAQNHAAKNVERVAHVGNLPVKYLAEFRALTKEQGQNVLEVVDSWLTRRNAPGSREPTVEAGMHVYGYNGSYEEGGVKNCRWRGATTSKKRARAE